MDKMQQTRWGSHIPINKTLHELFDVTGVMELGMGFFSTPIFTSLSPYTISIESDIQWIDNLEEQGIGNTTTHKIVHHNINNDNIDRSTDYTDISDSVKETANILYDQYLTDNINYLLDVISPYPPIARPKHKEDPVPRHRVSRFSRCHP